MQTYAAPSPRGSNWVHSSRNGLSLWSFYGSEGPSYSVKEEATGGYTLTAIDDGFSSREHKTSFSTPQKAYQAAAEDTVDFLNDIPSNQWVKVRSQRLASTSIKKSLRQIEAAIQKLTAR